MNSLSVEYSRFFCHIVVALVLALCMVVLSLLISPRAIFNADAEHFSAYECGFNPFSTAREPFSVHFYAVGIMFIVFDAELMFLFPWALSVSDLSVDSFLVIYAFLGLLAIGFIYEMQKGVLNWHL